MRHDPEQLAAAYLGQVLGRRARGRYEHHLLRCEDCWREVAAGRAGRAAAESLRELAPPGLRDRVRAVVDTVPETGPVTARRRRAVAGLAAAAVLAVAGAGAALLPDRADRPAPGTPPVAAPGEPPAGRSPASTTPPSAPPTSAGSPGGDQAGEPAPLLALAAAYRDGDASWSRAVADPPAPTLGRLRWQGSRRADMGGQPFVLHRYAGPGDRSVLVAESSRPFPHPSGERPLPGADWIAEVDRVTLLCIPRPSVLVAGVSPAAVTAAAADLAP